MLYSTPGAGSNGMKVAVTGAAGMLARDLIDVLAPEYELLLIDRLEDCDDRGHEFACMDLVDETKVGPAIKSSGVGLVFHCAAFTDVDGAEQRMQEACQGNALATARVAAACRESGIPLVTISTDYVFDGTRRDAYLEFDHPNPQSVYGKSKLWSEQLAFQSGARVAVVRTSWLFGVGGKNFVKTIRRLCSEKDAISVVEDQRGSPTYTVDLSEALARLARDQLRHLLVVRVRAGNRQTYRLKNQNQADDDEGVRAPCPSTRELRAAEPALAGRGPAAPAPLARCPPGLPRSGRKDGISGSLIRKHP
jgi:dTDP-4-dehydrorhamnose reductase